MKFPWDRYEELPLSKRNTLQIFITNDCNLKCPGCFARNMMVQAGSYMDLYEYYDAVRKAFVTKNCSQINILGGEPLMHSKIDSMCAYNSERLIKTTIYTNGLLLSKYKLQHFRGAKLRVSVDGLYTGVKAYVKVKEPLKIYGHSVDINYMIGGSTTLQELLMTANSAEHELNCKTFFISSYRNLDNGADFFAEEQGHTKTVPAVFGYYKGQTGLKWIPPKTMPILHYKQLVHNFLNDYNGNMEIHISKRGVFESTTSLPHYHCKFANYFIGGKIIQCPYDVVNLKYQKDYEFDVRPCQQNNTCLMSKIIVRRKHD